MQGEHTHDPLQRIRSEALQLPDISETTAQAYRQHLDLLLRDVNHAMGTRKDLQALIGGQQMALLFDNHKHHAAFMATVLQLNAFELLAKTIPWVYRTYFARGFSPDYFPIELKTWQEALQRRLPAEAASVISNVYAWMLERHAQFLDLAKTLTVSMAQVPPNFAVKQSAFQAHALAGDHRACLGIAAQITEHDGGVEELYLHVIQPTMENVGILWEQNEISVADEHLTSAVVSRVLTQISLLESNDIPPRHTAIVSCVANESHELGAWMMADLLERNGWDVKFLGANTPPRALIRMVENTDPDLLMLSITLFQNIPEAQTLIQTLRQSISAERLKIMVGGQAFQNLHSLWVKTGADGFAPDPKKALALLDDWFAL